MSQSSPAGHLWMAESMKAEEVFGVLKNITLQGGCSDGRLILFKPDSASPGHRLRCLLSRSCHCWRRTSQLCSLVQTTIMKFHRAGGRRDGHHLSPFWRLSSPRLKCWQGMFFWASPACRWPHFLCVHVVLPLWVHTS